MYPILFRIGPVPVPAYGAFALTAFLVAIVFIRRYARVEGLDPSRTTDAIVLSIFVAFLGARVLEVIVNWRRYFLEPGGLRMVLFSTGVFLGAIITVIPFGWWWFRRQGIPVLVGLDIVALVASIAEGVGRWGCFFSGCCWGTPTHLPWAVTFPELGRRLHAGLPDVPLHPTQIYMSLISLTILGILMLLYRRKRFHGQIIAVYVVLYCVSRFFIENVRGDEERGFVLGGLLSTSQFLSIVLAAGAIAAYVVLDRRHRASGEPDWRPATARRRR